MPKTVIIDILAGLQGPAKADEWFKRYGRDERLGDSLVRAARKLLARGDTPKLSGEYQKLLHTCVLWEHRATLPSSIVHGVAG